MKRANNKPFLIETSGTKSKISVSAKTTNLEKPAALKKKTVIATEKIAKNSKPLTSVKISVSATQPKKAVVVNQTTKQKKEKLEPAVPTKNLKSKKEQVLPKIANKKVKAVEKKSEVVVSAIKPKLRKTAEAAEKKVEKKVGKKIEIVVPPSNPKPVKKKIKPIGSAVVRGKTGRYDFEVFPLDAELKDGSAIYVISKRITDKSGRGHHKFVCIGQTESLLGDLKKHAKEKCIKQHKANVICLLREESEKHRVKIETDLREAHTIFCNQK